MKSRLTIWTALWIFCGCASITTPTGGPKDLRPPKLVSSIPQKNQINFNEKTIDLIFDEPVGLNNSKEEIIISPSVGKDIDITARKNRVTITPENGWKENTTYSILFREGIRDLTEQNSPRNLRLAFSTGSFIDSLKISGNVADIISGVPADKVTVAIYQQDTFDLFSHAPEYLGKTSKTGTFSLQNLKEGTYRIYAFDDRNKNLKVESRTEAYGFLSQPLTLKKNIDSLRIGLVRLDARPLRITSRRIAGNVTRLRLNKGVADYSIKAPVELVHAFGDDRTQINFWGPSQLQDSIPVSFTAIDSLQNQFDSTFYIKKSDAKPVIDRFTWAFTEATVEPVTGKFNAGLTFSKPLASINFDSVYILLDTITKIPLTKENISIETVRKKITIEKNLDKKIFVGEANPTMKLMAKPGFIYSMDSDTSKASSMPVTILWAEDTGTLLVEVQTSEPSFIVELTMGSAVIRRIKNASKITFKNLVPGQYKLRAIVDANKNDQWDAGNIKQNREPERMIHYISVDKKDSFPLRANWEYGPLILRF